ncbi:unnamed protein product [Alopecurus aequalis]
MPPDIRYGLDCCSLCINSWTCEKCLRSNQPIRRLLFMEPKYLCDCGKKFTGDFRISIDDIKLNGYNLLGKFHYQTGPRCVAHAYVHALQNMERLIAILMKQDPSLLDDLNPDELSEILNKRLLDMEIRGGPKTPFRDVKLVHAGLLLKEVGLKGRRPGPNNVHMVGDITVIPKDDFERITTAIAEGEALVSTFYCGKRLRKLKYGQIYKAYQRLKYDGNKKKKIAGHAVCLVGAGREKGKEYFDIMNSHRHFCMRCNSSNKVLKSGVGRLRASDLKSNVIRLARVAADGEDEWRLQPQNTVILNKHNRRLMNRVKPVQVGEKSDSEKPPQLVETDDIDDEMEAGDFDSCMEEHHDQTLVESKPHIQISEAATRGHRHLQQPAERAGSRGGNGRGSHRLLRKGIKIRRWSKWRWRIKHMDVSR